MFQCIGIPGVFTAGVLFTLPVSQSANACFCVLLEKNNDSIPCSAQIKKKFVYDGYHYQCLLKKYVSELALVKQLLL